MSAPKSDLSKINEKIEEAKKIVRNIEDEYRLKAFEVVLNFLLKKGELEKEVRVKPHRDEKITEFKGLHERIIELREEGFFSEPKNLNDVMKELKNRGYYYGNSDVGRGLLRLTRKKELRRLVKNVEGKEIFVYTLP